MNDHYISVDFDNYMQHDAHEFLNFLINDIKETIISERNAQQSGKSGGGKHNAAADKTDSGGASGGTSTNSNSGHNHTWISDIFQGILTSETKCLNCETVSTCIGGPHILGNSTVMELMFVRQVTSKDEDFFDLSIDVEQNTSVTSCLRNFSSTETLCSDNKFQCDTCSTKQEAHVSLAHTMSSDVPRIEMIFPSQKRMRVKRLPTILALHLKRFKYMEQMNRFIKVSHRVVFPLELRLFNTVGMHLRKERYFSYMPQ